MLKLLWDLMGGVKNSGKRGEKNSRNFNKVNLSKKPSTFWHGRSRLAWC